MKHAPIKALLKRRGMVARLLIVLLVAAMSAVICPMPTNQAQAAPAPLRASVSNWDTLKVGDGAPLGPDVDKKQVRSVKFTGQFDDTPEPSNSHCWNAGEANDTSILGCATPNGGKWDVEYSATKNDGLRFPVISRKLFAGWTSLTTITGLELVDTSQVTDMAEMFSGCSSLDALDLSHFDTSKVTDMQGMFLDCHLLKLLDVSRFNTSNVKTMANMFRGCGVLVTLDVSHFDTAKVMDMAKMFCGCRSLVSLDLSHFNTANVANIEGMFLDCRALSVLDLSKFDTSKVRDANDALQGLAKLYRLLLGSMFNRQPGSLGLDKPYSPTRPGHTPTNKWQNVNTGAVYVSPSDIPARAGTYEPNYRSNHATAIYTYRVRFDGNGGSGSMTEQSVTSASGMMLPANKFSRDGYVFDGWSVSRNGPVAYRNQQLVMNLGSSSGAVVTLYARWAPDTYAIRYDAAGGTLPANAPKSRKYGQPTNLPVPTKNGYIFAGWYDEKRTKTNVISAFSKEVKVTAQWVLASSVRLKRLGGADRYETMASIVREAYPNTARTVIVASGENYPDALAASGLSGVLDAPIVLTAPRGFSPQAASQLSRLRPSHIVIVGGPNAVSQRVQDQLRSYTSNVERLGGSDRYDTSYLLYRRGGNSWGSTAVLATGSNYADALSVSSYAYAGNAPVFLCNPDGGLTPQQRAALKRFSHVLVVGGERAVSSRHLAGLPKTTRLGGTDRYHTSMLLARWTQSNGLDMSGVVYATGDNFPDALAAGPLAGRNKAPVLLVSSWNNLAVQHSAKFRHKASKAYVVGGPNAVSVPTANAIADALGIRRP